MSQTTLQMLHEDLEELKAAVAEIRRAISLEPELREDIKARVHEARKRMETEWVSHEDLKTEFGV